MTPKSELIALAERCEAASGADRELDGQIWHAINPDGVWGEMPFGDILILYREDAGERGAWDAPPEFSASLDAAMTLVPEGCQWGLDSHYVIASVYSYWEPRHAEDPGNKEFKAESSVSSGLPLALCAAALRARSEAL